MYDQLHKLAFLGGIGRAYGALQRGAGGALGRLGARVGGAVGNTAGRSMGAQMGQQMGRQAVMGAAFGGLIEGGLGAYQAGEGHRLEGFARGAGHGAATGALGGAASGAVTAPMRQARMNLMRNVAGASKGEAAQALKAGYGTNLKHLVMGGGPGGRGAAAIELAGSPLTLGLEAAAGGLVMPNHAPPEPQPAPQQGQVRVAAAQDPQEGTRPRLEPMYATPFTSALGAGMTDAALDKWVDHKAIPALAKDKFLRRRGLPAIGGAMLTIPAYKAIKALNPPEETPEQAALKDIDVDALKYYFGKQPTAP